MNRQVWHFDFSDVRATGTYFILDEERGQRSYEFVIAPNVYNEVLKQAVRTFFYQRAGFAKEAQYAGEEWADGASHVGPLQDLNCRSFFTQDDPSSERDVSGGWYDAGDFNKYTSWTANYVVDFMKAYLANPEAFGDDYNIPESGNGIPDFLDEAKWGIDHLLRLQLEDGSVLSIVGESHGSPPSAATGASYYGKVNTSGTLNFCAAMALSSKVFRELGDISYSDTLLSRALKAWDWCIDNPRVLFNNNDGSYNSSGLGAGQMETNDYGRLMAKLESAVFLFEVTGDTKYRDFFDANYEDCNMMQWNWAFPFQLTNQEVLLHYITLEGASQSVADDIRLVYSNTIRTAEDNLPAITGIRDPYYAHLQDYVWGSNSTKSAQGVMYLDMIHYDIDRSDTTTFMDAGLHYINYIHGVNPLSFVYLSNMYKYGAERGVNEFYHSWFANGSSKWDRVGTSLYGPAPGYLPGGANPHYDWDGCCPSGCGSTYNNSLCNSEPIYPPKGQPEQKSYRDFNNSWPLNSWSVTENSCGYQITYIRLLSNYVSAGMDCNGDIDGTAFFDSCGVCAGGNTGIVSVLNAGECGQVEDCNGDVNGVAFLDSCGICSGGETGRVPELDKESCNDCNGDFNGTAYYDACGNCAEGETGISAVTDSILCKDCNGDYNGLAFADSCGICSEGNTGRIAVVEKVDCYDCNEEFNGSAFIDSCGICAEGSTGITATMNETDCYDCNGDFNGSAYIDSCGICADGLTGIVAILDTSQCATTVHLENGVSVAIYPNPTAGKLNIVVNRESPFIIQIYNMSGSLLYNEEGSSSLQLETTFLDEGMYQVVIVWEDYILRNKFIKI
ncbi:glycoside hydrolase family 9 protein [Bacteroidota bacterium]